MKTIDTDVVATAKTEFETRGYAVVRGILDADDVRELQEHFAWIHETGADGHYERVSPEEAGDDPLLAYPRVMNPHRYSDTARAYASDGRYAAVLRALFDEEPLAVQSMLYFK
ncbi:MAG TPA: phytanoyl-CoA dioxygenase family protein, partial [Spirochaetia bacterium]|nr:phytanoyl-CoA dioxygenase family protein [Spirochaetia bacterium]